MQENPPWLSSAIADSYVELENKVPPKWLPRFEEVHATRRGLSAAIKEYGCGSYGCVIPTLSAEVVLKATTDESEAKFAHEMAGKLVAPVVVRYFMAVRLSRKRHGQRIYLLWRETADQVGKIGETSDHAEALVDEQWELAKKAFDALYHQRADGEIRAAVGAWLKFLDKNRSDATVGKLFAGMARVTREQKVLFGDVHAGNLGLVDGVWKIIDPGNIGQLSNAHL